jgi:F-type H+-transporting ATPase subunit b
MRRIGRIWLLLLAALLVVALAPGALAPSAAMAQDGHEAAPAEADAGHDAGHEEVGAIATVRQGLVTAITSIVVFLIVLAILSQTVWPRIVKGLDERAAKIREEITAAEQARAQSKDALEQYERALQEAKGEARRMLDETKAQQQKLSADLRAKADAELASMRERARADIEAAKKSALTEIYNESAGLATMIASKILQRELGDADRQRLLDESLREMQSIES